MKLSGVKRHLREGDTLRTVKKKMQKKAAATRQKIYSTTRGVKRVAIIGWIGAFNLGDEMMLDVTLGEFRCLGITPTLITHRRDEEVAARYTDTAIVPRRPLSDEAIQGIVKNNDALFVNGGAVIDDRNYTDQNSLARDISRLAHAFTEAEKKVVVYGISTNSSIVNIEAVDDYKYLIEHSTYFSVRDKYSKDELAKIADASRIHIVDDIVFADTMLATRPEVANNGRRIVVIPIFDKDTTKALDSLLRKLIAMTRDDIRLVLFYDEEYHEHRSLEAILQKLGYDRYRIKEIMSPKNAVELRHALGDARAVISMRYHGTLFASALGKKVIRLDHDKHPHYNFKNRYLADEYGYGTDVLKISDIPDMPGEWVRTIVDRAAVPDKISTRTVHKRAVRALRKVIKSL